MPVVYFLIRSLFKFVLTVFYGSIVVENQHYIPPNGHPCVLCCNHGNSLTDPLVLVTSIPKTRHQLRLTAKDTLFGKRTFSSWLIEASGALPMKRAKDHGGKAVDNSHVMEKLKSALEGGDMICLFPEGLSRYHPQLAPLKTGAARIVSDVLTRNRHNPDFEISLLTCSITYMHREHFRSDVLVTFHPPMKLRARDHPKLLAPVDYDAIRQLTTSMQSQISMGTIDAPSWDVVKVSKTAAKLYAPLGTLMSLGDYVRVVRTFVSAFAATQRGHKEHAPSVLTEDVQLKYATDQAPEEDQPTDAETDDENLDLASALRNLLTQLGLTDERVREPLSRIVILYRVAIRTFWLVCLSTISLPGLILWIPIFIATRRAVNRVKNSGPAWNTWDEITQAKLVHGLGAGLLVWTSCLLVFPPLALFTAVWVPCLMWATLRWLEDAMAAYRALRALFSLLWIGKSPLARAIQMRSKLYDRVMQLAASLGLPDDPATHFRVVGKRQKGQVRGTWDSGARYFSLRRRRKRDWNETLRPYDIVDYPDVDT
ncbi:hypothetical protein SISSUDRAFT_278889 [Sistotremastrum suecicum HHB10207 ss-3]|uniref:Phospholipid/glycerol acyltransferase domain-containing protein n=1 Tax=Sistotremastrum suecicum HHB10207 ss-3 TaxID=1314776 RepID=A0A166G8U7_9AGAM|nr:hypothetical protein SISSUDRAFT_278889 [Sistotremastrum suecicum HHB10207 ss-3]